MPGTAPTIAPRISWMRLASCPMPWELEGPEDASAIGTAGHGPLHPQALTWALGHYFPAGVLRATLAGSSGSSNGGDDAAEEKQEEEGDGGADGPTALPATPAAAADRHRTRGDTWLLERSSPGTCNADADVAGHILTSPRLEDAGTMGVEVRYGFNGLAVWGARGPGGGKGEGMMMKSQRQEESQELRDAGGLAQGKVMHSSCWEDEAEEPAAAEEEAAQRDKKMASIWRKVRKMMKTHRKHSGV